MTHATLMKKKKEKRIHLKIPIYNKKGELVGMRTDWEKGSMSAITYNPDLWGSQ